MKKISNRVSTMIQARQRSAPNPSTKCGQRAKRAAIGADIRNRKNGLHLSVTACPPRAAIHYCRVAKNDVIPKFGHFSRSFRSFSLGGFLNVWWAIGSNKRVAR